MYTDEGRHIRDKADLLQGSLNLLIHASGTVSIRRGASELAAFTAAVDDILEAG